MLMPLHRHKWCVAGGELDVGVCACFFCDGVLVNKTIAAVTNTLQQVVISNTHQAASTDHFTNSILLKLKFMNNFKQILMLNKSWLHFFFFRLKTFW